jgi:hypothetical protein
MGSTMLIDIDSGRILDQVPHEREFSVIRRRLTAEEFERMVKARKRAHRRGRR